MWGTTTSITTFLGFHGIGSRKSAQPRPSFTIRSGPPTRGRNCGSHSFLTRDIPFTRGSCGPRRAETRRMNFVAGSTLGGVVRAETARDDAAFNGRSLRIALVSGSYNYIRDGIALTLNRLVDYLVKQGVEVLVFAPVGPKAAFEPAGTLVPIASVPLPLRTEYRVALGLP